MAVPVIEVQNLKKYFTTPRGLLHAVDDVTFTIEEGKTLGVVGESGFIKLCKCFGKGRGFAVGMILIPYVFSAIIAFDRSVYTIPANAHHGKEEA